jgi:hypothetical protein
MPGVGGILFLFRGSSISLCATLKLAWLGFRQCVPPSVEASKPRPMSVRRYSASHSLMFSLRARLVPPVDCHVPTFLLTSTTLAGWPDLQHPTGLEGIAPTLGRLRVSSVSSSAQASSLRGRNRTCYVRLYRPPPDHLDSQRQSVGSRTRTSNTSPQQGVALPIWPTRLCFERVNTLLLQVLKPFD